ncbi:Uncharacterised protein [Vibrio cholerae]|uniref:Uncharacterized protein n=1 Tax=Vibrio cholerae TaxID=666 RepID=A0A655VMD2_VIBCL|nr:Uncharacterised protein [Vibrio cholerae]
MRSLAAINHHLPFFMPFRQVHVHVNNIFCFTENFPYLARCVVTNFLSWTIHFRQNRRPNWWPRRHFHHFHFAAKALRNFIQLRAKLAGDGVAISVALFTPE